MNGKHKRNRSRDKRRKRQRRTLTAPSGSRTFSGAVLRGLRQGKDLSLEAIAVAAGTTRTTIDNWERGHGEPSASAALAIAERLNVPLDALYVTQEVA